MELVAGTGEESWKLGLGTRGWRGGDDGGEAERRRRRECAGEEEMERRSWNWKRLERRSGRAGEVELERRSWSGGAGEHRVGLYRMWMDSAERRATV